MSQFRKARFSQYRRTLSIEVVIQNCILLSSKNIYVNITIYIIHAFSVLISSRKRHLSASSCQEKTSDARSLNDEAETLRVKFLEMERKSSGKKFGVGF